MLQLRSRWLVLLLVALFALVAVGCGDDDDDDTATTATTASDDEPDAAAPSGEPVKLMVIAPTETTTGQNYPDFLAAAKAAALAINDDGGIGGRPVEILYCNEKNDPNEAARCGREAVSNGVVAVVGGYSRHGGSYMPILEEASIPNIALQLLSAADYANPVSFPIDGGTLSLFAGAAFALDDAGATKIAVVRTDVDAAATASQFAQNGIKAAGLEFAGEVAIPIDASDYAPFAAAVQRTGANGAILIQAEQPTSLLLQAFQQAGTLDDIKLAITAGSLSQDTVDTLGPEIMDGLLATSGVPPVSAGDDYPELEQFQKEMDAAEDEGIDDADVRRTATVYPWAAVHVVDVLGDDLDTVDAASLLKALQSAQGIKVPFIKSWTPNRAVNSSFPRISNPVAYFVEYDGTELVLSKPEPLNIFEAMGMATAG
jgi:ABC-type branched-subunit amino acid transport system substrate-binding protein